MTTEEMNMTQDRMEAERRMIAETASEIANLWWARPDENGAAKTQVVRDIIQKHMWGFTDTQMGRR